MKTDKYYTRFCVSYGCWLWHYFECLSSWLVITNNLLPESMRS